MKIGEVTTFGPWAWSTSRHWRAGPTTPGASGPAESCRDVVLYQKTSSAAPQATVSRGDMRTHASVPRFLTGAAREPSKTPDQRWFASPSSQGAT